MTSTVDILFGNYLRAKYSGLNFDVVEHPLIGAVVVSKEEQKIFIPEPMYYKFMLHYGATVDMLLQHAMNKVNKLIDDRIKEALSK